MAYYTIMPLLLVLTITQWICLTYTYTVTHDPYITIYPDDIPSTTTNVSISGLAMSHLAPDNFSATPDLTSITIRNHYLTDLPDFGIIKGQLEHVDLSSGLILYVSPTYLTSMVSLLQLILQKNKLDYFPDVCGLVLVYLSLKENLFTGVPKWQVSITLLMTDECTDAVFGIEDILLKS